MKAYRQQIIDTTEARRHNGQCPCGPWMELGDVLVPDHVREVIADVLAEEEEASCRDMRQEKHSSGTVVIGGQTWMYRR